MNVNLMAKRQSVHDRAVAQQRRRQREKSLVCPSCGKANRPGAIEIDIDDFDDARCPCGEIWQVPPDA